MGVLLTVVRLVSPLRPFTWLSRLFSVLFSWSLRVMEGYYSSEWSRTDSFPRNSTEEDCDSTWDDDEEQDPTESDVRPSPWTPRRNTFAAKDMQNFRHMVPKTQKEKTVDENGADDGADDGADGDDEDDDDMDEGEKLYNLRFYKNEIKSRPDGVSIEEFHKDWFGEYRSLEWVHSYIQWLFPIQEPGMNSGAHVLTLKEIKYFRANEEVKERLLRSYRLMLDFYGIKLLDEKTGKVARAENWKERFENMNRNTHNSLRITRILKCLGILGFQHLQPPLVRFFLQETLVKGKLPRVKNSVLDYFMFAVLDKSERKKLIKFAFQKFEPKQEFVWCPQRIQRRFMREMRNTPKNTEAPGAGPSQCPRITETSVQIEAESQKTPDPVSSKVNEEPKTTSQTENGIEESSDGGNTLQKAYGGSEKMSEIQETHSEDTNKDPPTNTNKEDMNLPHQEPGCSAAEEESEVKNGGVEQSGLANVPGSASSDDEMIIDQNACMLKKEGPASDEEYPPENQRVEVPGHHTEETLSKVDENKEEDSSTAGKEVSVGVLAVKKLDENESSAVPDNDVERAAVETGPTSEANEETQE